MVQNGYGSSFQFHQFVLKYVRQTVIHNIAYLCKSDLQYCSIVLKINEIRVLRISSDAV